MNTIFEGILMKRKITAIISLMVLSILGTLYFLKGGAVLAIEAKEQKKALNISSKAAYVCDYDTQTVIYAHNENARLPIASMVKIMTLILCYEHLDSGAMAMDDVITASENAASMGGSQAFWAHGQYKIEDLIKA